jgi:hypothetical protein
MSRLFLFYSMCLLLAFSTPKKSFELTSILPNHFNSIQNLASPIHDISILESESEFSERKTCCNADFIFPTTKVIIKIDKLFYPFQNFSFATNLRLRSIENLHLRAPPQIKS